MGESTGRIVRAFIDAQKRRPYAVNEELLKACTPPGGEWSLSTVGGAYTIMWGQIQVARVNPDHRLNDTIGGEVAQAMTHAPIMDCALRTILVLAESPDNLALIKQLATTVIASVERPAPEIDSAE